MFTTFTKLTQGKPRHNSARARCNVICSIFIIASPVNFCNYYFANGGEKLVEKWTGRLVGKMHNNGVSYADIANELGVTKAYVSMILNGARKPKDARQRLEAAVDAIIERRTQTDV